jgi:hypothetical protein
VAFVFGAVFVAAGLIVLAGGELIDEGRALIPAGLIALGVALLVHVGRRGRPPAPAGAVAPQVADDRDLDALFAPIDDALADWDRANAAATPADAAAPATDATEVDATKVDGTDGTEVDATEVDGTDGTEVDATDATKVDVPEVDGTDGTDATEVDITEVDPTGPDATPTDPEADVNEVVDPTERYPRREPE